MSAHRKFERQVITVPGEESGTTSNNYLLIAPTTRDAVLIDAAGDPATTFQAIQAQHAHVRMILLTHGHPSHWHALGQLREALGVPVGVHLADVDMLPLTPNFALSDGQNIAFGTANVLVLHTPGHTPGSVCFLGDGNLFSGDTLLQGTATLVSSGTGDTEALARSTEGELLRLPDSTLVFPGHGEETTIHRERQRLQDWLRTVGH